MALIIQDYKKADEPTVCSLLSDAFFDDPAYTHVFPAHVRRNALGFIFSRLLRMRFASSEKYIRVAIDGEEIVGVIVGGPSTTRFGTFDYIKHGLVTMPFRFGFRVTQRMLKSDEEVGGVLNFARALGDYDYISELAVRPDRQGRGIGSRLLAQYLKGRDRRVVLIATKLANVEWYENHGFVIHKKVTIPDAFPVWLMFF